MISNKPFNVVAFGSPVVDVSNYVDQAFLTKHSIKKGEALITETHENAFINEIQAMEGTKITLGGSAMNTLRAFNWAVKSQKDTVFSKMCSGFADDGFAKIIKDGLKNANVGYIAEEKSNAFSPRCGCGIFEKDRSMVCYIGGVQKYSEEFFAKNFEEISNFDLLILEGYYLTCDVEKIKKLIQHAEDNTKIVASSISSEFVAHCFTEPLKFVIQKSDFVFSNLKEAQAWAQAVNLDAKENGIEIAIETCKKYKKASSKEKIFVITHDEKPVTVVHYSYEKDEVLLAKEFELPIQMTMDQIEDTNGAGDTFMGTFLAGKVLGKSFEECLKVSNYASSLVLKKVGCDHPLEENLY